MLVIGLLPLPPLPLCALVLLIVLLTGNIKILLVLVAFGRVLLSRSFPSCLLGVCFPSPLRPCASCFLLSCSLRLVCWGRPTNCPIGPCLALFHPVPALEGSVWFNPVCPSFLGLLTLSPWLAVWPYPWLLFVCNTCLTKEILFHLGSFHHTPSSSSARWGLLCAIDFAVVQCKDFSLSLSLSPTSSASYSHFYIVGPAALRCHARESMVMCPSYIIHIIYRMGPPQL